MSDGEYMSTPPCYSHKCVHPQGVSPAFNGEISFLFISRFCTASRQASIRVKPLDCLVGTSILESIARML